MNKIDIDRYNKGQDKYNIKLLPSVVKPHYEIYQDGERVELLVLEELILSESWREVFDKDPDYQKECIKWIDNKYGIKNEGKGYFLDFGGYDDVYFSPQMLTGYILEFIKNYNRGE